MKAPREITVPSTVIGVGRPVDSWLGLTVVLNPAPPWRQFWARVRWCFRHRQIRAPRPRRLVGFTSNGKTHTVTLR